MGAETKKSPVQNCDEGQDKNGTKGGTETGQENEQVLSQCVIIK